MRAAVIGWPVAQSRSPLIHTYWLAACGLPGTYERAAVPPDGLATFIGNLRRAGYVGGNVTLPHKTAVLPLCAALTETARALGAVNTLWFEGTRLHGDNTDVAGFLRALDDEVPGWDARCGTAAVLGAGGAARAILHALASRGVGTVRLVNRTLATAQTLVAVHPGVVAVPWAERNAALAGCDLVVNTTALGMTGKPALDLDLAALPPHAVVDDIVYTPLETPLVAAARAAGHRAINGLGMLLHQAAPGFARWFGEPPVVTAALRTKLAADIAARG